jgi:CBS domain-containing protein
MKERSIRHLPLATDTGDLIGIITERDLRVADGVAGGAEDIALSLIGTDPPFVVDAETPLHSVLNEMADERKGSAMVTQDGELVGILTTTDACRYLAEWLRAEFPAP